MGGAPTKALEVNQSSASVSRTYSLNSCGLFPFHLAEAQLDPSTCFGGRHGSATDKKDAFPPHTSQTNTSYRSQLSRRRPLPKHVTHADARFSPFLAADTKRHGSYHAMSVNLIGPHAIASFRPLPPGDGHDHAILGLIQFSNMLQSWFWQKLTLHLYTEQNPNEIARNTFKIFPCKFKVSSLEKNHSNFLETSQTV